ncbi:MAG TPA: single-stranded DNA-binding protein [Gemmataceae bacterium]|nr:single-stranded DNA-binding protein [Gemmataceae bacterium]
MANLNKVMLIGRLTRDPEVRTFGNGGKVAKFGFAVNNRRKNQQTGQWEDEPVFLEVEAFNRGEFGKQADLVEQYLTKGRQVFIEGHLKLDQWEKDGQKQSRLKIVLDNMQFLEPRPDGVSGAPRASAPPQRKPEPNYSGGGYGGGGFDEPESGASGETHDDIPF